ncbi:glutamine--tRNA ligase-like protein [Tanacetum coccineum]
MEMKQQCRKLITQRMKTKNDRRNMSRQSSESSWVLIRYAFPIKCTEVVLFEDKMTVVELHVEYDQLKKTKPKAKSWRAEDWLNDLNPESKVVISSAYDVPSLKYAEVDEKFQFDRLGYFKAKSEDQGILAFV